MNFKSFQVLYGLPSTSWWLALSVTSWLAPRIYLHFHAFVCKGHWERKRGRGKVEQIDVEENVSFPDLNSSSCTPFTFTHTERTRTHTLASVLDLTKPSLLRAKVKQMRSSHCYSLNKRVRMNKQRPSGGRNTAQWKRCFWRGQRKVIVTVSKPEARLLVVNSKQQVDRWYNWPETLRTKTFWCYLYYRHPDTKLFFCSHLLSFVLSTAVVRSLMLS